MIFQYIYHHLFHLLTFIKFIKLYLNLLKSKHDLIFTLDNVSIIYAKGVFMSDLFNKLKKGLGDNMPNMGQMADKAREMGRGNSTAGMLGAAGVGGILGALFGGSKNVKKVAKNAAVIGGSAALAALAYKMYQNWSNKSPNPQQQQGGYQQGGAPYGNQGGGFGQPNTYTQGGFGQNQGGFGGNAGGFGGSGMSATQGGFGNSNDPFADFNNQSAPQISYNNDNGKLIIEAMVFAARADGHIDADEQKMITSTAEHVSNDPNFMNTIRECLQKPLDPNALASKVGSYEQGLDIYRLSAAAIETDNQQEHNYLVALANALRIDNNTKAQLDNEAKAFRSQVTG